MSKILSYSSDAGEIVPETFEGALLIASPFSLHDSEPIIVAVEEYNPGIYRVTDRAMAADSLAIENIDLSKAPFARSWSAIQSSVDESLRHLGWQDPWEISAFAARDDLGFAVNEVVAAVLRADGLSGMSRPRVAGQRLDRAVIKSAHDAGLVTVPKAPVRLKSGATRSVTARVSPKEDGVASVLIQTFGSSKKGWEIPDLANGLFGNLEDSNVLARVSVLGDSVELDRYQMNDLRNVSDVVAERDLSEWMLGLAA